MSDIAELEGRITAALERISTGLDGLAGGAGPGAAEQIASLKEALEAEKIANAQLEERVAAIKDKQDTTIKDMGARIETLTAGLAQQEAESKRLIAVNAQLRESSDAQSETSQSAGDNVKQLNQDLQAELDALQATRKADLAELETIMSEIKPLIGESA